MPKFIYHFIWVLILLSVNLCALPVSIYALFTIERGTNITTLDYALAIIILITSNFITFQLFLAIKSHQKKNALFGIIVGVIQIISFILFMQLYEITGIIIFVLAVFASLLLIIKTWKNKNPAMM